MLFKVRFIASIVGQIISTQAVLGDQSRLRTRYTYECILNRVNWNSVIMISKEAFGECRFWLDHVDSLNEIGSQLCQLTYNGTQYFHVFCDASEIGFGGHLTTGSEDEPVEIYGSWSREEQAQSSTWRELEAVNRVLRNVVNKLNGKFVRVYTDNKNVTHIIRVGSRKNILHSSVIEIHELCMKHSIKLSIVWIPREANDKADSLSRKSDCDDWEIEDWLFKYLDQLWGPHSVDRFAHDYNTKCKHFNSQFWCPGTNGIDSFTLSWYGKTNWLVPPPRLLTQVINKLEQEKCNGTLVVPEWTSAPFWPKIIDEHGQFRKFIIDHVYFQGDGLTKRGRGQNSIFGLQNLKFRLLALRVHF